VTARTCASAEVQTEPIAAETTPKHTQNLIVSLQQEVSLIKRRAAEKTLEIFMLRKKLQAATSKLSTAILPCRKVTRGCQVEEHLSSDPVPARPTADTEDKLCQTIEDNYDAAGMHIDSNLVKHNATVELGIQTDEADAYAHMMATMKEHVSEATVKCELEINANHQLYAESIALQQQQYAMQQQQYATLKHQYNEVVEANAQQFAAFTQTHDNLKKHTSEVVKQNRDLQKEVDLLTKHMSCCIVHVQRHAGKLSRV
jgi:hypothetical protein